MHRLKTPDRKRPGGHTAHEKTAAVRRSRRHRAGKRKAGTGEAWSRPGAVSVILTVPELYKTAVKIPTIQAGTAHKIETQFYTIPRAKECPESLEP